MSLRDRAPGGGAPAGTFDAEGAGPAQTRETWQGRERRRWPRPRPEDGAPAYAPDSLLVRLARALERADVPYCQWKGHTKRARLASLRGDIDLLVDEAAAERFAAVLAQFGFRLALPAPELQIPGVVSYLAPDPASDRLVHVHAHYRLILGRPHGRHYRLPIEDIVLESATRGELFRVPAPEYELLLFVLHQTLRHRLVDVLRRREPPWLTAMAPGLAELEMAVRRAPLARALRRVPDIDLALFDQCRSSLWPRCPSKKRLAARFALERRLDVHGRRPPLPLRVRDTARRFVRRVSRGRFAREGKRLATGGRVIALVGADGSGKSTCAHALERWLGRELYVVHAHMGKPPRSLATLVAGALLKVARQFDRWLVRNATAAVAAHFELLRCLCTARDRRRLHRRVRRVAGEGGVAICERYPVPQNRELVGPSLVQGVALAARSRMADALRRRELECYTRITPPDLLLVLRIDPEQAVARKTTEPAAYVRRRARVIQEADWTGPRVRVIDAGRPLPLVLAEMRDIIWARWGHG